MTGADNNALLNEIAQLAGAINKFKQNNNSPAYSTGSYDQRGEGWASSRGRGRGRGRGGNRGGFRGRGGSYGSYRSPYSRAHSLPKPHRAATPKIDSYCSIFTRTGTCSQGQSCRYKHDPSRVALCRRSLKGECRNPTCTLSHEANEHNAPLCTHFAKGRCTREDCKYTHMTDLTRDSPTCRAFALEGWCDSGARCHKCHIYHCPDFEETGGKCPREKCPLKHVLRATQPSRVTNDSSSASSEVEKVQISSLLESLVTDQDIQSSEDSSDEQNETSSGHESSGSQSEDDDVVSEAEDSDDDDKSDLENLELEFTGPVESKNSLDNDEDFISF